MKHYLAVLGFASTASLAIAMAFKNASLQKQLACAKLKESLTCEELMMAFRMLDRDEQEQVKDFFDRNHKFLQVVFKDPR